VERAGDDAALELADRERRRHVRTAVVDRDEARRRVGDEDVEIAGGHPAHRSFGDLRHRPRVNGRDGTAARAGHAQLRRIGGGDREGRVLDGHLDRW
jgi:hypothetical protein